MAGKVLVDGVRDVKPGMLVRSEARIEIVADEPYVGRGGHKLAAALEQFSIDVVGRSCADVGASTGGFTDVLLQNRADLVYAIDVGHGLIDWNLRKSERVVLLEKTNARHLKKLPGPVSFVCIDVSFISVRLILPSVKLWLDEEYDVVVLVKPQFEAGRRNIGKGGIVRSQEVHMMVLRQVIQFCSDLGLNPRSIIESPIRGAKGNREYLLWLRPDAGNQISDEDLQILTAGP